MLNKQIKTIYHKILYKKKIHIEIGTRITGRTYFEGANKIGQRSELYNCNVGYGTYICKNSEMSFCQIGRFCSIGNEVRTIFGRHPTEKFVSTHPAFFSVRKQAGFTFVDKTAFDEGIHRSASDYSIIIGNDVWIGDRVSILEGVKIGNGAIIAAGAVVVKDVEPYSIVGGVPAKHIKTRFNAEEIRRMENIKWWDWDLSDIKRNAATFSDVELFLRTYER